MACVSLSPSTPHLFIVSVSFREQKCLIWISSNLPSMLSGGPGLGPVSRVFGAVSEEPRWGHFSNSLVPGAEEQHQHTVCPWHCTGWRPPCRIIPLPTDLPATSLLSGLTPCSCPQPWQPQGAPHLYTWVVWGLLPERNHTYVAY